MTEADIPMVHAWLQRPHVVKGWGGEDERPTLKEAYEWYLPWIRAEKKVAPCIALLNGEAIGYAQSYVAMGSGDGYWEEETDPGVHGIDQFLADPARFGKGLGTLLVRALVARLFADPSVTKIQTDPDPMNLRAIRCYEKAGFRRVGNIVTPDGPSLYMVQERPARKPSQSAD